MFGVYEECDPGRHCVSSDPLVQSSYDDCTDDPEVCNYPEGCALVCYERCRADCTEIICGDGVQELGDPFVGCYEECDHGLTCFDTYWGGLPDEPWDPDEFCTDDPEVCVGRIAIK